MCAENNVADDSRAAVLADFGRQPMLISPADRLSDYCRNTHLIQDISTTTIIITPEKNDSQRNS